MGASGTDPCTENICDEKFASSRTLTAALNAKANGDNIISTFSWDNLHDEKFTLGSMPNRSFAVTPRVAAHPTPRLAAPLISSQSMNVFPPRSTSVIVMARSASQMPAYSHQQSFGHFPVACR